jgi:hypothetical protein
MYKDAQQQDLRLFRGLFFTGNCATSGCEMQMRAALRRRASKRWQI